MKHILLVLSVAWPVLGLAMTEIRTLDIGLHLSESLTIPRLKRVAVANGKVVKVKALPPSRLLISGLSRGETMVRVWDEEENETVFQVRVTSADRNTGFSGRSRVVRVALEFLEMNEAFSSQSGFRWPEMIQFGSMATVQGNQNFTGINYEATFSSAKGFIRHLVQKGWAKVLASPSLYVRLGEEAVFQSGGEFPVTSSSESFGRHHRHVEWKNFGLTAKVKPSSLDELHISSDIHLEMSELSNATNPDGVPSLTKRNLVTKMNSVDGETVLLSGLVRQATSARKESIPILGDIPLLGSLFSSSEKESESTELLMAVTFSMTTSSRETEELRKFREVFSK